MMCRVWMEIYRINQKNVESEQATTKNIWGEFNGHLRVKLMIEIYLSISIIITMTPEMKMSPYKCAHCYTFCSANKLYKCFRMQWEPTQSDKKSPNKSYACIHCIQIAISRTMNFNFSSTSLNVRTAKEKPIEPGMTRLNDLFWERTNFLQKKLVLFFKKGMPRYNERTPIHDFRPIWIYCQRISLSSGIYVCVCVWFLQCQTQWD